MTDLGWRWPGVPDVPNLFFETSWVTPAPLLALFRLVPPDASLVASCRLSTDFWAVGIAAGRDR